MDYGLHDLGFNGGHKTGKSNEVTKEKYCKYDRDDSGKNVQPEVWPFTNFLKTFSKFDEAGKRDGPLTNVTENILQNLKNLAKVVSLFQKKSQNLINLEVVVLL